MGWTEDFDIQTVGVMPPVVERCRGEHGERTPDRNPGSKRRAKTPQPNCPGPFCRGSKECGADHQPPSGEPTEQAAQVDRHVRWRPKRIASDGAMPGDVPKN